MSKHKLHGKDKKKGSQLLIRVDKAERDAFVMLCDQLDTSAAREIRRFMRELVAAHSGVETAPSDETENTVIAVETDGDTAISEGAATPKAALVADTPAAKPVRARKKPVPK